ncbi:MAG: tRNA (N(6)-L-threonylcarbamoyladenosine(37)-C(2))-methylthiotransferase MtaB [Clostridia bacterium]|nr:tRNA (N(6)-L-threonylcarbamoyladenosine(37)-C(2))-methylthiotransferase MtaB [Clostridia bacterium]
MNVIFHTLGCKVNQYETQIMREIFIKDGFTSDKSKKPDVIVINSCSVTAESDRKTRQLVRKSRKENMNAIIVLTGCMVQAFPNESKQIKEADIILGNKDFSSISKYVFDFVENRKRSFYYFEHKKDDKYNTSFATDFSDRTRAYMKIEDGCDRFCSYCIIPYARGRVRSRSLLSIKKEAEILSTKGFKEIVLVGINLSAFGKGENFDLCDAVNSVCDVDGIMRVRLGSLEPDHITNDMLYRLESQPKFCPQFHLSLQSGCDETLKRMNRKYDSAFYEDLINRIRDIFPDSSITTDIMVGFAGETQEEFKKSFEFVKKIGFSRAHIFPYSKRSGTIAANLNMQVTNSEKEKRAKMMTDLSAESEKNFNKKHIGKTMSVLFESPESEFAVGYTENYIRIKVKSDENLIGQIKNVKITDAFLNYCIGEII